MEKPDTRVISLKSNNHITPSRQHRDITTWGVGPPRAERSFSSVKGAITLVQDVEIVAVKVDRMREANGNLLDDKVVPFMVGQFDNVVLGRVGSGGLEKLKGRVIPVDVGRHVAKGPSDDRGNVDAPEEVLRGREVDLRNRLGHHGHEAGDGLVGAVLRDRYAGGGWVAAGRTPRVPDYTLDIGGVVDSCAAGSLNGCAEPVVFQICGRVGLCLDNDIISLPVPDQDRVDGVRGNGDEVCGDNLELMIVERETESGFDTGVNKPHTVLLPGDEGSVPPGSTRSEHVLSMNQSILRLREADRFRIMPGGECGFVIPLCDHYGA